MRTNILYLTAVSMIFSSSGFGAGGNYGGQPKPAPKVDPASAPTSVTFKGSNFESCQSAVLIGKDDYTKNKIYWDQAINHCKNEGIDIQVLPEHGFFSAVVSSLGDQGEAVRSQEFLKKLGERAASYIDLNNRVTDHLFHCTMPDKAGAKAWFDQKRAQAKSPAEIDFYNYDKCENIVADLKKNIAKYGPEARVQHDLMVRGEDNLLKMAGSGIRSLTDSVGLGGKLPIEKAPLTAAEKAKSDKIFAEEEAAVNSTLEEGKKKNDARVEAAIKVAMNSPDFKSLKEADPMNFEQAVRMDTIARIRKDPSYEQWYRDFLKVNGDTMNKGNGGYEVALTINAKNTIRAQLFPKHFDEYAKVIGQVPVLVYLDKANPSDAEINAAMQKVLDNGKAEATKIKNTLSAGTRNEKWVGGGKSRPSKVAVDKNTQANAMLDFMKYGPVIRDILKEDPSQCGAATSVGNYVMSLDTRDSAYLIVGMLGAVAGAAIAGPAILASAGVGAGLSGGVLATLTALPISGGIYYSDYKNYMDAERRAFSVADATDPAKGKNVGEFTDFLAARDALTLDAALAMTGMDLWGLGIGKAAAGGAARLAAKPKLVEALVSKGIGRAEATQLLTDLRSADKAVAKKSATRLAAELGMDPNELDLIQTAAKKGLITETNPEVMDVVRKEIAEIKDLGERKRVYQRTMEILNETNSAKFNDSNRAVVLEAAVAGAKFGVRDPKYLAAKINDWNDVTGLKGLTETYNKAKTFLDTPEIRAIASTKGVEAAQAEAFGKGLDLMRKESGAFDDMTELEWKAQKEKLMVCGLRPAAL